MCEPDFPLERPPDVEGCSSPELTSHALYTYAYLSVKTCVTAVRDLPANFGTRNPRLSTCQMSPAPP